MVKALFITLNLAGLIILPFLYVGIVNVEHQAPSEVDAGSSIEVEITLDKSGVTGPARLKLDFSDAQGLIPESIINGGASFSYNDETGIFIWTSIQPQEQLVLKYRIKADGNASGVKTISGSFSYLDEEERKTIDIPSIIVTVKAKEATATNNETNTTSEADNISSNDATADNNSSNSILEDVTCNREISKSGDDFIIKIDINKGSNGGFARVKETVPNGFNAVEMEKSGAVFKFVDNNVKFLWTNLPENKSTITVKYKLKRTTAPSGTYNVDGEFSGEFLIVNDVPKSVKIPTGTLTVDGDAEIIVENNNNISNNENKNTNTNNSNNNNTNENNNEVVNNNENKNKTTIVQNGNTNITYKVQVLAAHKTVSNNYIKRHYGYSGGVALENHEGWVKYTTGSFGVYKEARDKRNSLNSLDFPGPFVTAYNKGERITVQEALMISKQDWVK
jgi:hypothetical protein